MILTTADINYIPKVKTLILSCARNAPDHPFYLFLVNVDRSKDNEIKSWHSNIVIEHVFWDYRPSRWRGMLSSARSILLYNSLKMHKDNVLYLDSDIIVRRPLVELFAILSDYDLTIKYRPELNHLGPSGTMFASKFNAGVIGIRYSENGLAFAKKYNKYLWNYINSGDELIIDLPHEKINTYIDQEMLYITYLEFKNRINFLPLPVGFNDSKFLPQSTIWHGKGTAYNHPIFTVERKRYQSSFHHHALGIYNFILNSSRSIKKRII
jgi:lipopolysaccharide biosynthesis glycosyltransferase